MPLTAYVPLGADVAAVEPLKWLVPEMIEALTETLFQGAATWLFKSVAVMLVKLPVTAPVAKFALRDASPSNAAVNVPPEFPVVTSPATLLEPEYVAVPVVGIDEEGVS